MTKRERVIAAINKQETDGVPSGFFIHFPHDCIKGEAAVKAHVKYFEDTDMDMPLRYNNDKQKKPLFSRGLSVCRLLFNSFSKLKIDENYKEKRRLFY